MTEPDATKLRAAFKRRRSELGHRTDVAFADAAGIPYRTLVNLLAGKPTRIEDTVELQLGWAQGSVAALRQGGEATVTEKNPAPQPEIDRPSVGPDAEDAVEALYNLPRGLTPRQRENAKRIADAAVREYLATLEDDEE